MQPECISQRASSGRLNCSCSRSRDLTAINPVVPEMMKIAALAVSTAKKYNIDFSLKKVKGEQTRYLVFFKGRDADVMTAAFQEFSAKKLNREKKPSIRKALAAAKDKAKQLNAARDKVKKMDRGREI